MEAQFADERKPVPVITDISQRAIRERNPEDPLILPSENGTQDYDSTDFGQLRKSHKKKDRYGNYASAIRKADPQSELVKRKQKYAAALEGARVEDDDLDEFYKGTGINPCEPDIMSTVPVDRIKKQYLSSAKEEGKVVPRTEEAPAPHHIEPQWPPREDMLDGPMKPRVIQISSEGEKHKRDGVDGGHIKPVNTMKDQWQNLPEKYKNKPMGVNKPTIDIVGDRRWITHFRPVIDEGKAPDEPEWLKTVRNRRWLSTVRARFPEDEHERIAFERRSTTPRKFKKPNPHTVMRSSSDLNDEFEEVMRRRRKRSDSADESSYLTKSASTFVKSASTFVKSASSFYSDGDVTDAGKISSLKRNAIKGPIKEYLKNLSLERSRNHMLKWAFTADVVDEPYRYDLPKPVDLIVMDELEREHQWKYEQAKQRFGSEEGDLEGTSMQSLSQVSFASEEDLPEKSPLDESAGFIPKLTDIQQKLLDEVDSKPTPKSVAIEEDTKIIPKLSEVKDKLVSTEDNDKMPFTYGDDERFEGIKNVKNKLPKERNESEPQDYVMPTTVMKKDKDLKKMMEERKKLTDENIDDRAESAAQEIRSLASDISKTFGSDSPKENQEKADNKESVRKVSSENKPEETKKEVRKTEGDSKRNVSGEKEFTQAKPKMSSLDQEVPGKKKPEETKKEVRKTEGDSKRKVSGEKELTQAKPKMSSLDQEVPGKKKPEETKKEVKKTEGDSKRKVSGEKEFTQAKPKVSSFDQEDSGKKKPEEKKPKSTQASVKEENNAKSLSLEEKPVLDTKSTSNLKAFADHRRRLRPSRKHAPTSNPIKARQKREDLRTETDFLVSKAERNHVKEADELEKPIRTFVSKKRNESKFAAEALEGLSRKENLKEASTALRKTAKNVEGISIELKEFGGFLSVMLLQIKGYRHLQTRLVEPSAKSLNSGDAFVLVTEKNVYVWLGKEANIMKKAKAAEVSTIIVKQRDLGTNTKTSHMIEEGKEEAGSTSFWKLLGGKSKIASARQVPTDEEYEKNIQATNLVYRIDYSRDPPELKFRNDLSGKVLSEKFMDPDHAYVLDFGPEVYLWLGRSCNRSARLKGMKLAQEIFDGKFKYKSRLNPFHPSSLSDKEQSHEMSRPKWALLGRMTARSETVLFREKFIDWPDHNVDYTKDFVKKPVSGSFAVLNKMSIPQEENQETGTGDASSYEKQEYGIFSLKTVDVNMMIELPPEPSLVLENFDIGRGIGSVDEEGRRFSVTTVDVKVWHVKEYGYNVMPLEDYGHFHSCEGYIVRWKYCVKRTGVKSLKGKNSRIEDVGRDKIVYFFWQGQDSTINEKGAAALMTVELDSDRGPQVLVAQGKEPPCFPRLFGGKMVVHQGKREPPEDEDDEEDTCMFIVRNEDPDEVYLLQVKTDPYALRSRTSFVVVDLIELILYVWHGAKSSKEIRNIGKNAGKQLTKWFNDKFPDDALEVQELEEGDEPDLFWDALRGDQSHVSLKEDSRKYDFTLRVFSLNSSSGQFVAKELLNPSRSSSVTTPYPILQSQLYSASQPAIFLIDAHYELYMWQGWWPRDEEENEMQATTTGSAQTRFSNDRRLAMETIKSYAQELNRNLSKTYIIFAGLEPKSFKTLFPYWEERNDVRDINMEARKDKPVLLKLEEELARLSRDTYSLSELQKKPLPDGVDPTRLEMYLHVAEFEKAFGMSKNDFESIPTWKKLGLKKKANLF